MDGLLFLESSYSIQTETSICSEERKLIIYNNDSKQSFTGTDNQLIIMIPILTITLIFN